MRVSRRVLDVGADGKAAVMLLTDPIPRHLSIVSWGANDAPAASWKSADVQIIAHHTLRSPPSGDVVDTSLTNRVKIESFMNETMSAWIAALADVLSKPLESADRAAQIRGLTAQAGARIAAVAAALGSSTAKAVGVLKSMDLKLPSLPTTATIDSEIERRRFLDSLRDAAAYLKSKSLEIMSKSSRATEDVLLLFGEVSDHFSSWAASTPRGVVGVSEKSLKSLNDSLSSMEKTMTIEELERLAQSEPKRFLETIKAAIAASGGPEEAKKFMWGETGEEPGFDSEQILSLLSGQGSEAFEALVMSAVGGINLDNVPQDNTQVASSFKSVVAKAVMHELKSSQSLKKAIMDSMAQEIGDAISHTIKSVLSNGGDVGDHFSFDAGDEEFSLTADLPGMRR